jgi:hypothetical protein
VTVDRLSSLSAQLATLRAELARKKGGASRTSSQVAGGGEAPARPSADKQVLRAQLATIVQGVAADSDPGVVRRRIIGAVLQWEFGAELREHPEWRAMVETIADTMAADARAVAAIDSLINDLSK